MKSFLFKNTDIAPLVVFRIFFGFLIACESFGAIISGWTKDVLIAPQFTFSFIGFEWIQPLSGNGMYYYFATMGILGILIMIGLRYTTSMFLFCLLWTGTYLMQKSSYNNHYYLLMIISFMMIFLPANRYKSLDVKLGYTKETVEIPYWMNLIFIIQIAIVYFYASIAKFYPDWLDGTFTKNLLHNTTAIPFFLDVFSQKWFYLFIAYAGIIYDLLIIPLLLYRKTRTLALLTSLLFHLFNAIVLQIGIFPFFALSFALFFYDSEKIRKIFFRNKVLKSTYPNLNFNQKRILYFLFIPFLYIQLVLPLRHYFIEGDVLWTEEGHRLSWRMMLRERSGYISFEMIDNTTKESTVYDYSKNLTSKQARQLPTKPDFIWQYCQKIKEENKDKDISIYVNCSNSINRKPYQTLIDPKYDMAKAKWNYFFHNEWILLNN
ncbi:HTTM domain-containing protein [Flavobacterium jejuense]|uniref:HTTM domain-containing protein n=1 Tax=Flavobacterium jejuense TaxID=1544455 RepID=A0ABX0IUW5_9FLAO|nr:HTTM domain-containing protein [Flavobacterium jejuense]NHN27351.1 HTTM domain-containing protein [Flavobacterium jejuense]